MKPNRDYLTDILRYIADIESFTEAGESYFMENRKTQRAVIRAYEVIGEVVKPLPQTLLDTQVNIDWKAIKGFRDILIHQYDNVNLDVVWQAIQKLPALRSAIETILDGLPDDE
jgi:uncharacterized protein with HEPN domain